MVIYPHDKNENLIKDQIIMSPRIVDNPGFREFVSKEFGATASHATVEELAAFAFGNLEDAITAYKQRLIADLERRIEERADAWCMDNSDERHKMAVLAVEYFIQEG